MAKEFFAQKRHFRKTFRKNLLHRTVTLEEGLAIKTTGKAISYCNMCFLRNIELAKEIEAQITKENSNNNIHNLLLELDSLGSVRDFIKVSNKNL